MSTHQPLAMVVVSLLAASEPPRTQAIRALAEKLGELCWISEPIAFDFTDYYEQEMGAGLTRRIAAFTRLVEPWALAGIKRMSMDLEQRLAAGERRRVNIDPGLLTAGAFVLATHKPRAHRPAIGEGLYAECTLYYKGGAYQPLPWTYPDYASEPLLGILGGLRERYLWLMRQTSHKQQG